MQRGGLGNATTLARAALRGADLVRVKSALTPERRAKDRGCLFAFTDSNTDAIEKFSVRMDMSERFQFLAR